MDSPTPDIQSRFVNALRTQATHHKTASRCAGPLPCPYGHPDRLFQSVEQVLNHARTEHVLQIDGYGKGEVYCKVREDILKLRQIPYFPPDVSALSLDVTQERQTSPSGKKRRADSELSTQREKTPSNVGIIESDYMESNTFRGKSHKLRPKHHDARLCAPKRGDKGVVSPRRSMTETTNERLRTPDHEVSPSPGVSRQPGLIELQKYDPRYPGLLLQPDSRPISQEQLASEVKSIYAGLTMVESKCIHVDRAQAIAPQDPDQKLAPDHWQALIALHRTLLHEHYDIFLASQHPSGSPALRRLAAKYTMPARMWKHGTHTFLELLRQKIPEAGLEYMSAFLYPAYQMMAILYETVPAFDDTWIERLGGLEQYKMVIGDGETDFKEIMMLFKPPGEDYPLSHNTCFDTQWLSKRLYSVLSRLKSFLEDKSARLRASPGLHRALALGLLVQKAAAAPNTQPPSAVTGTGSPPLTLGSLLVDKTPFDYVMYGVLVLYLVGTWLAERLARRFFGPVASQRVRNATKYCSLALTTAMALFWIGLMGDSFAAGIYITVVKIWAATTFHFVLTDCCDAIQSNFHVAKFIGLGMLFEFTGMAMQQFAASSTPKALPPALTAAAVINWALYVLTNHVPSVDAERGVEQGPEIDNDAPGDEPAAVRLNERLGQQQTGVVNDAARARRRNSIRLVERPTVTNGTSPGSNPIATSTDAISYLQQTDTVENASRPRQNTLIQENRHEDSRFVVGDGFDDVSLHHN